MTNEDRLLCGWKEIAREQEERDKAPPEQLAATLAMIRAKLGVQQP